MRPELYLLYFLILHKTRRSGINGSCLIFNAASFACNVTISNNRRWRAVARNKSLLSFQEGRDFFRDVLSILRSSFLIKTMPLKWYYDQKITFIFSSDFETLFTKHSPSEILSLNSTRRLFI